MKLLFALCLCGCCGLVWAETSAPAPKAPDQVEITSDSGLFDGITFRMTYLGHVFVTDNVKASLHCGRLTVCLPPGGGHPTNIVAETGVVIDYLDEKGQTNHVTADKAIYAYSVVTNSAMNVVTNENVTFTGGSPMPKVDNPQVIIMGEPLVLDVATKQFGGEHYKMILKQAPNLGGTNGSPFNFTH
jgi:hypothetical protein